MVELLCNEATSYVVQIDYEDHDLLAEDYVFTYLADLLMYTSAPPISPLAAINFLPEDALTPKKVAEITGELYDKLTAGDWDSINATLVDLAPDRAAETTVLAVLRGTYSGRRYLKEWAPAVKRAAEVFSARGRNAQRLLRGLL
jgi:hypothetical protein